MRPFFFLLLLTLLSCPAGNDATSDVPNVSPTGAAPADPLEGIREAYTRIQQQLDAGSLRADTITVTCQHQDGEFFLVRHFDGEDVVMLRTTTGIGHAFTTRRMYFVGGRLIFAWTVDEQFGPASPPEGSDEVGWASAYTETRYYIQDGAVVKQLTKTYEEQSWNEHSPSADIPNEEVDVPAGTQFPYLDELPAWKEGHVDC